MKQTTGVLRTLLAGVLLASTGSFGSSAIAGAQRQILKALTKNITFSCKAYPSKTSHQSWKRSRRVLGSG